MKRTFAVWIVFDMFLLLPSLALAGDNGLAVKAGTLGVGIEYERSFNDNFGIRLGANYFQYDGDFTAGDIDYNTDVDLQTISGLIDWYPMAGAFRLSGGIFYNGNEGTFSATPAVPVRIGDVVYTPAMVGTLNGKVIFNTAAPYLGVGWSSGRDNRQGLSVAFDFGVLFQGEPSIEEYYATGPLAGNPAFQSQLAKEVAKIEDELDPYQFYPVVALTLTYRF